MADIQVTTDGNGGMTISDSNGNAAVVDGPGLMSMLDAVLEPEAG